MATAMKESRWSRLKGVVGGMSYASRRLSELQMHEPSRPFVEGRHGGDELVAAAAIRAEDGHPER